ncbi:MAG TPA: VWA domain-containing protein [Pyrinomonadaceae bacterium]|nr:VWA domain-containing protein [Pyrinomonadaceae bacterium]
MRLFAVCLVIAVLLLGTVSAQDPIETVRIDTDLVDLKVSVIGAPNTSVPMLEQKDFVVLEDGKPQEISFFAAADAPFDLVLLLDLSGSNSKKLKMIRNSAKRFVEAARPTDRIAVVTFTEQPALYSAFTLDRVKLKKSIDEIDDADGGTNFWDALDWVVKVLIPQSSGRRSAVVVMTDGVDNALPGVYGEGSKTPFGKLLEDVRNDDSIVFPIYLDTEDENVKNHHVPPGAYSLAREQLALIASSCGTPMYRASKLNDLDQVYQQVVRDLSTVYSIGYRPANKSLDGKWRTVEVQLVQRPDLFARTKRGYYAKLVEASR